MAKFINTNSTTNTEFPLEFALAGHVVLAMDMGMPFKMVTLDGSGERPGLVENPRPKSLTQAVCYAISGPIAAALHVLGVEAAEAEVIDWIRNDPGCEAAISTVETLLTEAFKWNAERSYDEMHDELFRTAIKHVRSYSPQIEKLARYLEKTRTLTYAECESVLTDAKYVKYVAVMDGAEATSPPIEFPDDNDLLGNIISTIYGSVAQAVIAKAANRNIGNIRFDGKVGLPPILSRRVASDVVRGTARIASYFAAVMAPDELTEFADVGHRVFSDNELRMITKTAEFRRAMRTAISCIRRSGWNEADIDELSFRIGTFVRQKLTLIHELADIVIEGEELTTEQLADVVERLTNGELSEDWSVALTPEWAMRCVGGRH